MTATIIDRNQNSKAAQADVVEEMLFVSDKGNAFEEIEMGIASDGIDFILDLLSDLSVNRGAYALREAYSNAYDATMSTGDMTRKIEITLPYFAGSEAQGEGIAYKWNKDRDVCASYAVIRDHGCGMSENDVRKYFTQYGGSKKRDDDVNSIGSKGLGSKAPLACADSFTVKSVKDGILTTAIIERKNGRNYASLRAERTDEENGTEVVIPVVSKQVAAQMSECARSIAQNNLDANLWINGEKQRGFFETDPNARGYNRHGYVYLGVVNLGVDTNGEEVSFRMWQREDLFPTNEISSIDLNLAGVKYDLYNAGRGGNAALIVAGEPGFLNFTPSRDEIKQDAARLNFIEAVKDAFKDFDFSESINNYIAGKNMYATYGWLTAHCGVKRGDYTFGKTTTTFQMLRNRKRWGWGYYSGGQGDYATITVDNANLFVYDGIDCSWLLGNTNAVDACSGNFYGFKFDRNFFFARCDGDKTSLRYNKSKKTELADNVTTKTATPFDMNTFANYLNANWTERSYGGQPMKIVVISDVFEDDAKANERLRQFANWEKNIRDWAGTDRIHYLLAAKGWKQFSDSEKAYLDACFGKESVLVETIESVIANAKTARNAARTTNPATGKPESKVSTEMSLYVSKFDGECDPLLIAANAKIAEQTHEKINMGDAETVAKSLVVFGVVGQTVKKAVERVAYAMICNGIIDKRYTQIIWCADKFRAADVKEIVKSGALVLADCRTNVKNFTDNVFADNGVTVKESSVVVPPRVIYGDGEVSEDEKFAYIYSQVMAAPSGPRVLDMMENVTSIVSADEFAGTDFAKACKILAVGNGHSLAFKFNIKVDFSKDAEVRESIVHMNKTIEEVRDVLYSQEISMFSRYHTYSAAEKKILAHGLVEFITENFECAKA